VIIKVVGRGPGGPAYNIFAYDAGQEILTTYADRLVVDNEVIELEPEEMIIVEARKALILSHKYVSICSK